MNKIKNMLKKIINSLYLKLKSILLFIDSSLCIRKLYKLYNNESYIKILSLKYKCLNYVKEKNVEKFKDIKNKIEDIKIKEIGKKEKIKIGFVIYTSSMWSCDKLFNMFLNSERYDPYIILCEINDGEKKNREQNYFSTLEFFKKKGYKIIDLRKNKKEKIKKIYETDIIFYLTPFNVIPKGINIKQLPLKILTIYIPYSFMLAKREYKFNLPMYSLTWKFFVETYMYKNLIKKKCVTGDDNVTFCGYTRMDEFLDEEKINDKEIWKIPQNSKDKVYKIIYAPHHSVFDENAGFSTFDQNGLFMYELAQKYKENTSWIIKPHPLLRTRVIKNGFFKDVNEYDEYLKKWDELPNAKVVTDGTYFDIFKTSDSMILDSVSFLAEYQYVHKPLLLLTRNTQHFNEFGEELKKVLYCVDGKNLGKIENYLKEVVIEEKDIMKDEREEFFSKYLDYYKFNNNQLASKYIYNFLENIFKEWEK